MDSRQPPLNREQQAAAFCGGNAVVAAGAGSGKTRVLASRFAWLLTEKNEDIKIDGILTLTFTKKAAAEMHRRIHSLLSEIAENAGGGAALKARNALEDFIHARIQTLDSYSASLVRQSAAAYGISPDFTIDQERCRQIAAEESLPFLISRRHDPAIEWLYSGSRPDDIAGIFTEILFNNCQIDRPRDFTLEVKNQFDIIAAEWEKISEEIKTLLKETKKFILDDASLLPDLLPLIEKSGIIFPGHEEICAFFNKLLELPPAARIKEAETHPLQKSTASLLAFLSDINKLNLRKGKQKDNPVKENIKQLRAIFGLFSSLAVYRAQAGFIISIASLLEKLQERYLARKRSEGILTFTDVANLSKTILLEQTEIRQSEKESFKAIMIDEFQDNNEQQRDLLFLLAEKKELLSDRIPKAEELSDGKLFFVGDEKQSIYLFRGADVAVFRKLKSELKSADLPLKTNYRSSAPLIGAFNAIFGGSGFDPEGEQPLSAYPSVFVPEKNENPPLPLYEASYSPLKKDKEGSGQFSICILNKNNEDDADDARELLAADENEARFVAGKIQRLLKEKKYSSGDIAVLFRSGSVQRLYEKHLRLLGIPYASEDIKDFFYGGPVNDIMSILRLAAYPLDSAAYAETLRSPFAGLSLPGTAVCLSIFRKAENPAVFNDEPLSYLEGIDREKYARGQKLYFSIREKASKESVSSLVTELWYNEGYRFETEWNPATGAYSELYDYLFHLAVKADNAGQGLAAFTDSIRRLRDSGGQLSDIEIPLERPGAIHLMTIHKSKGLEFPVVFLCACGKHSQADRSGDIFFSDETGVAFSAPPPPAFSSITGVKNNFFWERAKAEKRRKRTAELRRLLYVGMTRAENELYITGTLAMRESGETPPGGDFSLKLKNFIGEKRVKNAEKTENRIPGDSIIDDDTFFGLLLPSIAARVPDEGLNEENSFFKLEEIPVYSETEVSEQLYLKKHANGEKNLDEYLKKAVPFYKNAKAITTPVIYDNHISPVSLKNAAFAAASSFSGKEIKANPEYSGKSSDDVFKKVDSMLEKFLKDSGANEENSEGFNSASFGTITHICVEALINEKEPVIPANIAGYLSPDEESAFLAAGKELARRFLESPLGKLALKAGLRESEAAFRSILKNEKGEEIFINGAIDLLFDDASSVHVVDFKTDKNENPAEHAAQMACYYRAVTDLYASEKECRVWLYYPRTGHAAEMTEIAKGFNLERNAFL